MTISIAKDGFLERFYVCRSPSQSCHRSDRKRRRGVSLSLLINDLLGVFYCPMQAFTSEANVVRFSITGGIF